VSAARAGALAGLCALLAACNPQAPRATVRSSPTATASPTPLALRITARGTSTQPVRLIDQIHNRVKYDLLASSAESEGPQGSTRVYVTDARITFHGKDGSTLVATAPHALVDQTHNSVTMLDGVRAHTATGMTLRCDRLVYDRTTEMLHGDGHVRIVDPKGFTATGSSFDSDVSLTHVRMI